MITFNKQLRSKLYSFIKHPFVLFIVPILISIAIFFLDKTYKKPFYNLSNPELIASKANENLKILYNNSEINNIYSTNLTIWNGGNKIIDYSDFVRDQPITLSASNIHFLSISLSNTSRQNLRFSSQIVNDSIRIRLLNDEALEQNDGASFLILFTKVNDTITDLKLTSRIKETSNGFISKEILNPKIKDVTKAMYINWGLISFMILFRIMYLKLSKKEVVFRNSELVFLVILFLFAIYFTYIKFFVQTALPWL